MKVQISQGEERVFQTVGAAIYNEREPKWRLARGTNESEALDKSLGATKYRLEKMGFKMFLESV